MHIVTKILFFSILSTLIINNSCKNEYRHPVPDVPVDIQINIYDLAPMGVGQTAIIVPATNNAGVLIFDAFGNTGINLISKVYGNGIVLYRAGNDVFYAFDRMCPHEISNTCLVSVESNSYLAKCPCCNSEFIISINSGLATDGSVCNIPLKEYCTEVVNGKLYISNCLY